MNFQTKPAQTFWKVLLTKLTSINSFILNISQITLPFEIIYKNIL